MDACHYSHIMIENIFKRKEKDFWKKSGSVVALVNKKHLSSVSVEEIVEGDLIKVTRKSDNGWDYRHIDKIETFDDILQFYTGYASTVALPTVKGAIRDDET